MRSSSMPQRSEDTFGREAYSRDDLRRRAARACAALAGRALVNHPTQLAITLAPEALAAATGPGAPAALLRAVPELPSLLSHARYVRTIADRRRPAVRRLHLLAANAAIARRPRCCSWCGKISMANVSSIAWWRGAPPGEAGKRVAGCRMTRWARWRMPVRPVRRLRPQTR